LEAKVTEAASDNDLQEPDPGTLPEDRTEAWGIVSRWSDDQLNTAIAQLRELRPDLTTQQRASLTLLQAARDFRAGNGPRPDGIHHRWWSR
jgi:hypothetical protein